jgi:alpha-L-rhamnosidase
MYRVVQFSLIILLLFSSFAVSGYGNSFMGEDNDLENALWIGTGERVVTNDEDFYKDRPAPVFRKEFLIEKSIHSATLYITAAGYYRASLNGERIGKIYLDPAWTNYSKRIYYKEYDLTATIKQGANCLGITLGNGFYNPLPLRMWGHLNLREHLLTGNPLIIARLKVEYNDGHTEEFITDASWKFSSGPIKRNNVYLGDWYDARDEIDGWDRAGFNESQWENAVVQDGPGGALQKSFFPPIQVTDRIMPISISSMDNNTYLIDMGVNFTGHYQIHLKGEPGDSVFFRFGERIYDNGRLNPMTAVAGQIKRPGVGGPGAPDTAWQADVYVFGENPDIVYGPEFTFHTYRYMEISGLKQPPQLTDIEGIALNTNVDKRSHFSSSADLINSIQDATERTFLANLLSVQSDCPAREKFGYGGDLNAVSESYIYNFDMQDFYRKTIYDWVDAISDSVFIDTAPFVGIKYCGLSWESAFLITQYNLYLYYNDTTIVRELYELDLQWMEKVARLHPSGLVETGLSDHESLEAVPVELTGTSHYLQCARIMATFADLLGDGENKTRFEKLAQKLQTIILDRFWNLSVPGPINRQTLFATLLYHDIIPSVEVSVALDSLLHAVRSAPTGHFTTGIFGTKFILEALSKTGHGNEVYNIVNSEAFPGWGFMISRGATTIWETWKESDNVYSNCHPMFGSVSEWYFRWLGGIRPDPDHPGFKKFIINPILPDGLTEVNCSYDSPYGEIVSNWRIRGDDKIEYEIKIPEGSVAMIDLPAADNQKVTVHAMTNDNFESPASGRDYHGSFELPAGEYVITAFPINRAP